MVAKLTISEKFCSVDRHKINRFLDKKTHLLNVYPERFCSSYNLINSCLFSSTIDAITISKEDFNPLKSLRTNLIKKSFKLLLSKNEEDIVCQPVALSMHQQTIRHLLEKLKDSLIYFPHKIRTKNIGDFRLRKRCRDTKTNASLFYLGALRKDYYPLPSIRIQEPHLALVQNESRLSLTLAGKLSFCKTTTATLKCYPNAIVFTADSKTILMAGDPFHFKPTWIFNTDWVKIKRFRNLDVQQLSRYNFDYFTDLILSDNSKLTVLIPHKDADNPTMIIRDVSSRFTTRYNDIETSEVRNHKNVVSELFTCCQDFLGVYLKMKMEIVHLAKILMPNYHSLFTMKWNLPWSNLIDNLSVSFPCCKVKAVHVLMN